MKLLLFESTKMSYIDSDVLTGKSTGTNIIKVDIPEKISTMKKMNILVTGGAGYVGSVLIPSLIEEGHFVKCLDRFFFGDEFLSSKKFEGNLELIQDDIRWFKPEILNNVDAVIDLAALSNDPVGNLDPKKTFEINHLGRVRVANLSKKAKVPRYILASSASIYGQQDKVVDETSEVFPLTVYSKANRQAEIDNLKLNDDDFCVTVLRFSSLYGVSPRMRFDISVNSMVLELFKNRKIIVRGKNNSRPFLHIRDAVTAYKKTLYSERKHISGEIFNVGSEEQNFKIGNLAKEIIDSINIDCELELGNTNDHRSYITSFEKIRKIMQFSPSLTLSDGAREIYDALKNKQITDSEKTITLKWYNQILNDPKLFKSFSINGTVL